MTENLLQGPLEERHRELGASFAEFGGWLMPVAYAGTVSEHNATRNAVGLFDVSHLGKALVKGPGAAEFVNAALTNDLRRIGPGKAQYTLCCTEAGGVIDDLIAYYVSDDEVFLVPNAANTAAVVAAIKAVAPEGLTITDEHRSYAVLAVQGPRSTEVLTALGLPTGMDYMGFEDGAVDGIPVRVCRTGYTGEHGYELVVPADGAVAVWDAVFATGEQFGVRRLEDAGLVSRTVDPDDARAVLISITPHGVATLEQVRADRGNAIDPFLEELDSSDRDTLAAAVQIMRGLLATH